MERKLVSEVGVPGTAGPEGEASLLPGREGADAGQGTGASTEPLPDAASADFPACPAPDSRASAPEKAKKARKKSRARKARKPKKAARKAAKKRKKRVASPGKNAARKAPRKAAKKAAEVEEARAPAEAGRDAVPADDTSAPAAVDVPALSAVPTRKAADESVRAACDLEPPPEPARDTAQEPVQVLAREPAPETTFEPRPGPGALAEPESPSPACDLTPLVGGPPAENADERGRGPLADACPDYDNALGATGDDADDEPVEISPEEALRLLASMGTPPPVSEERRRAAAEPGTTRIFTFESREVQPSLRVAGSTLARLCGMVSAGELAASLGPICQDLDEFLAEWDATPPERPVVVLANLSGARDFLSRVADERPGVATAYWIVFETLRSDVSITTSRFLGELGSEGRLRAVGYGPRNIVQAARCAAEAVFGHVEWGFGTGPALARAG